jgi:hypothetical protein
MTAAAPNTATFETTLTATGNNTGIVVPDSVIEQLGAGRRPPVVVEVNGYQYRSTVAVMGDQYLISVSAAVRAATCLVVSSLTHCPTAFSATTSTTSTRRSPLTRDGDASTRRSPSFWKASAARTATAGAEEDRRTQLPLFERLHADERAQAGGHANGLQARSTRRARAPSRLRRAASG